MDQQIYVNVETLSGNRGKRKKTDKTACTDEIEIYRLEPNRPTVSDTEDVQKRSCRAAAVILGLLCLLLLVGLITLVFLFIQDKSEWKNEMVVLYNNLTRERNEFEMRYNNLTEERDQLQTSYDNLAEERDKLQQRFEDMTNRRNDLQKSLQERSCCENWTKFDTSCYYFSTEQKTWEESRAECQKKGADLIIINNKEEQKFVIHFNKRVWIGLTDQEEEGHWKWVDGTTLTTRDWHRSQPDNHRGADYSEEDCAEIQFIDKNGKWNDISCSNKNYWVCETI